MKKFHSIIFLMLAFFTFSAKAQKISGSFNPLIKRTPDNLKIVQYNDNEYLVFGDIYYYQNEQSSSIIKTDKNGGRVTSFKKVYLDEPINSLAILASGKILIQGNFSYVNGNPVGNLILLKADGSVDDSFSTNKEIKITSFSIQSSGKIIIIYTVENILYFVGRLNSDGSFDDSYKQLQLSNLNVFSKVIVSSANQTYISTFDRVHRLLPDGGIDDTFAMSNQSLFRVFDFVVASDNKLIVSVRSDSKYNLIKLFPSGGIDSLFQSPIASNEIKSFFIRKGGTIAITGFFHLIGNTRANAAELNPDGTLNSAILSTNSNRMNYIYEDSYGSLYITGNFSLVNNSPKKYIVKLSSNFSIDSEFDLPINAVGEHSPVSTISIQQSGKLLYGGGFFRNLDANNSNLIRFNLDGTVDTTFVAEIRKVNDGLLLGLSVQNDDKILIGGISIINDERSNSFGRLLSNGALDTTFKIGIGPTSSKYSEESVEVIKVKEKKIYLAGNFDQFNKESHHCIAILDMDGNVIGPVKNSLPLNSDIKDIEIQSTGKIILIGKFHFSDGDKSVLRLNVDGTIDSSFKLDTEGSFNDIEVDQNDHFYLGGDSPSLSTNAVLLKFRPDGELENFISANAFTHPSGHSYILTLQSLPDGTLAIGGYFNKFKGTTTPGIVFLGSNGNLLPFDNNFDSQSFALLSTFSNNVLYFMGDFSKENGQKSYGSTKVLFDIENTVSGFKANAISDSTILLSWQGDFKGAEGIKLESSKDDNNNFKVLEVVPVNSASYLVKNLAEISVYHFRISGVNEFYSTSSFEVSDTTLMTKAYTIAATDITVSSFAARWIYKQGTDSCVLQVSKDNFNSFIPGYDYLTLNTDYKLIEGLETEGKYQYRVKRFKNGLSSDYSNVTEVDLSVLGIEDNFITIKVYPNPANDFVKIDNIPAQFPVELQILTLEGKLLKSAYLESNSYNLDIENLDPGVFIILFRNSKAKIWKSYKLIKL